MEKTVGLSSVQARPIDSKKRAERSVRSIRVGIVGAAGYASGRLLELLIGHSAVEVTRLVSESTGPTKTIAHLHKRLRDVGCLPPLTSFDADDLASACDLVFLSKPHGEFKFAPLLLERKVRVIDLSADYRLRDKVEFHRWYGVHHENPELLDVAVYGLPELRRDEITRATLVANPGCYPTSAILAAAPLFENALVAGDVIVNSISGVSGAGKTGPSSSLEMLENVRPYNFGKHRHTPEIEQAFSDACPDRARVNVLFTPSVAGFRFGLLSTVYLKPRSGSVQSEEAIFSIYRDRYHDERFVRIHEPGSLPEIEPVVNTNFCDIGITIDSRSNTYVLTAALDNTIKGAGGQAVQNMNLMFGLPETEGLPFVAQSSVEPLRSRQTRERRAL